MFCKLKIKAGITTVIISILAAGILVSEDAYAFRRERGIVVSAHSTHKEKSVVRKLHPRHNRIWFKKTGYYYDGGVFFRRGPSGFVVVRAPVGAVIATLPVGYRTVWVNGANHYYYGGVVYRRVPAGYVVVEEPERIIVTEDRASIVQPSETASGNVTVSVLTLNVRSGPDLDYPLIHQVQEDSILKVYGKADGWLYVQLPDGQFGWVKSVFTARLEPGSG